MSIPSSFSDPQEYFDECLRFLQKYSWIYRSSNTCFVKDLVLDEFPNEWIEYFTNVSTHNLNLFPERKIQTNFSNLDDFIQELDYLIPTRTQLNIESVNYKLKKMSLKKQHEITKLSALIHSVCGNEIDILIDFGCGLGYLSEILHKLNAYKIIGLESDSSRVKTSITRQELIYATSKDNVIFKEHFVTDESADFILAHARQLAPEISALRLGIIGLHACADLTIDSMKLFLTMENVSKLIIMPCCYHKMNIQTNSGGDFKNFPLSACLKEAALKKDGFSEFNRPFLRLACQQTSARWKNLTEKEHYLHSIDMFFRGVAEAILNHDEMVVKNASKSAFSELGFADLCNQYELRSSLTKERLSWTTEHATRFSNVLKKYPFGHMLAEGLTCLQATIQELCENIVLYDRICYMREQANIYNIKISVTFEKIMDDVISPRCYALIAQKL